MGADERTERCWPEIRLKREAQHSGILSQIQPQTTPNPLVSTGMPAFMALRKLNGDENLRPEKEFSWPMQKTVLILKLDYDVLKTDAETL